VALTYHKFHLLYSQIRFVCYSKLWFYTLLGDKWKWTSKFFFHSTVSLSLTSDMQFPSVYNNRSWYFKVRLLGSYFGCSVTFIIDILTRRRQFLEHYLAERPQTLSSLFKTFKNLPDIQGCISSVDKNVIRDEIITTTRYSNS